MTINAKALFKYFPKSKDEDNKAFCFDTRKRTLYTLVVKEEIEMKECHILHRLLAVLMADEKRCVWNVGHTVRQLYISSNREAGNGRFDIQMEPRNKQQMGYIMEFRAGKKLSEDELKSLAEDALGQIKDKQYTADMEYRGIKQIGLLGVGFCGKCVATVYEQLTICSNDSV